MFCRFLIIFCFSIAIFVSKAEAWRWAQNRVYTCEISVNSVDFGVISDTELNGKTFQTKITADCDRPPITGITVFPVPWGAYCMVIKGNTSDSSANGTRYLANTEDSRSKIYFNFFNGDSSGGLPVGEDFSDNYGYLNGAPWIGLLENAFGYFSMNFPITVRLSDSRVDKGDGSIGAGIYSGVFSGVMYYGASYGLGHWSANSASDCHDLPKGPVTGAMTVRATVKSSCSVNVENHIDFGKMPAYQLRDGFAAPDGSIKAHCSKGTSYQVGLSRGLHKDKAVQGHRAMQRHGAEGNPQDFIAYNLYQDKAHTQLWTDAWGSGETVKDVAADNDAHYSVYAYVPPQGSDKMSGVYQDTVRVEIRVNAQ